MDTPTEADVSKLARAVVNINAALQGGHATWGVISDENRDKWRDYVRPHYAELQSIMSAETMSDPSNEDTTQIDHELIANDLENVAKLAGRLGYPDMATEIGALVAKYRKPAEERG